MGWGPKMKLHQIGERTDRKIEAVIEELLELARDEGMTSFLFIAENRSRGQVEGMVGRCRRDPLRAIGQLAVLKSKLARWVAKQKEFPDSLL